MAERGEVQRMRQQRRQTTLARRGRANIQVLRSTRDTLKHLAQEHGITILDMVDRLIKNWNRKEPNGN